MRIGHKDIGSRGSCFIIAEIGVNHDGSAKRAVELVECAADAGADAVKFQYFTAESLLSRAARLAIYQHDAGAGDPFTMLAALELSIDDLKAAVARAQQLNIEPIVTVFSVEHVQALCNVKWSAYKVASPDIINQPLIAALCELDKPLILSTGAATIGDVRQASLWIDDRDFALMQCVSAYPTPMECANLAGIATLQKNFPVPVGYSDHTTDECTGGLAVAAGATLLEKHLTHDRDASGPDHAMSLDPAGFKRYVEFARQAARTLGDVRKIVQPIEQDVRNISRQSVVATRNLRAGHVLQRHDLTTKRPGTGIDPSQLLELVGATLRLDTAADMPLTAAHVNLEESEKSNDNVWPIVDAA